MKIRPELRRMLAIAIGSVLSASVLAPAAHARQGEEHGQPYQQWENMPPQQRERILQEQQRFKRLPSNEQERLRREYEQRRQ